MRCYSEAMPRFQSLPQIWLISDARNDAQLERALKRLPRGSGFIFRHYHLAPPARRTRFMGLQRLARGRGHCVVLAGDMALARRWGADGAYGLPHSIQRGPAGLRLATAHSLRELRLAARADAVLLSPVYATRSHPGGAVLGAVQFQLLAAQSPVPVIALGGMTGHRARGLKWQRWAGIDAFLR